MRPTSLAPPFDDKSTYISHRVIYMKDNGGITCYREPKGSLLQRKMQRVFPTKEEKRAVAYWCKIRCLKISTSAFLILVYRHLVKTGLDGRIWLQVTPWKPSKARMLALALASRSPSYQLFLALFLIILFRSYLLRMPVILDNFQSYQFGSPGSPNVPRSSLLLQPLWSQCQSLGKE